MVLYRLSQSSFTKLLLVFNKSSSSASTILFILTPYSLISVFLRLSFFPSVFLTYSVVLFGCFFYILYLLSSLRSHHFSCFFESFAVFVHLSPFVTRVTQVHFLICVEKIHHLHFASETFGAGCFFYILQLLFSLRSLYFSRFFYSFTIFVHFSLFVTLSFSHVLHKFSSLSEPKRFTTFTLLVKHLRRIRCSLLILGSCKLSCSAHS